MMLMELLWSQLVWLLLLIRSEVLSNPELHPRTDFGGPQLTSVEDDFYRNASELITSKGYPCKEYSVVTNDGFILTLQRIPHGVHNILSQAPRPVVFLQHGLLDASTTWIINSASQSLGFILADAGFDVWLGNMRGNTYSKRHVNLKPNDHQFWAWSWDEMAKYDLPAMLNFVLATTGQPDLYYIGHSQGTLIAFAQFSQNQLLAKQVKAFFALGPVATVGHIKGVAHVLVNLTPEIKTLYDLLGVDEFLPHSELMEYLASTFCREVISRYFCENLLFLITGSDGGQLNKTRLPVYVSHTPAGSSVQNVVHFAQMVKSKKFQMYDFGSKELNLLHYNQSFPPLYNVTAVNIPTYIYSGEHDFLSDPQDVNNLLLQLHSLKFHRQIPKWEHLDFTWAVEANTILYNDIVKILKQYVAHNLPIDI